MNEPSITQIKPIMAMGPRTMLKRRDLPSITGRMRDVLVLLRAAQQADSPFLELTGVDPRTIKALEERDWIVSSPPRIAGISYQITGRGLHALAVYEPVVKRSDGLCPNCGERPRAVRGTGEPAPYCNECISEHGKRNYKLGLYRMRPLTSCAHCQKRPRFVASSGKVYSYCKRCKNRIHRQEHKRQRNDLYKRVQSGETVPCRHAGCNESRYVSGKSVQDYCYRHYREYQNNYFHAHQQSSAASHVE